MKIIEVIWEDACQESDYLNLDGVKNVKPAARRDVGYEVDMSDKYVTITRGLLEGIFSEETGFNGALTIPKGMIISVKEIQ